MSLSAAVTKAVEKKAATLAKAVATATARDARTAQARLQRFRQSLFL